MSGFFSGMIAYVIVMAVMTVILVARQVLVARLRLNVYDFNESDPGLKFLAHGAFYILAGIIVTAFIFHIQHWPVVFVAAGALILGATLAPNVDWSRDSKLKRFAFCVINFVCGVAIGAFLNRIIPDITWI